MTLTDENHDEKPQKHLNNNAWVAYISPLSFIVPAHEKPLEISLEEINNNSYNHGSLSRIVEKFSNSANKQFPMLICYDGALAVPQFGEFSLKENAIEFFSNILCNLLIGGIYCEAIDTRDVVWGQLYEKRFIWPVDIGLSVSSQLHGSLRTRSAGPLQTILLSNPRIIHISEFMEAYQIGRKVSQTIYNFSPKFLIRGVTELKYRNWSSALSNLWISIEQLTDFLWKNKFLKDKLKHPDRTISGRKKALREDHRTWSSSVKQELLFQAGFIDEDVFERIFPARQARNRLVHDGKTVEEIDAINSYEGFLRMLSFCIPEFDIPLCKNNFFECRSDNRSKKFVTDESYFEEWIALSE